MCFSRKVAVLLSVLSLGSCSWANDNDKKFTDANLFFWIGLTSHEKNVNVSGTNVNCTFRVSVAAVPDYQGDTWDQASIVHMQVQCDDMAVTLTPGAGPPPPAFFKTIRIASTHFSDGSTISFTIKGKFNLVDNTPGGMGSKQVEFTHTATLKAYNKALTLATKEEFYIAGENDPIPITSGYKLPGEPGHEDKYPSMSRDAASFAQSSLSGTLNHTVKPASSPFDVWRETLGNHALDVEMSWATFFYAATHGESQLFRASLCETANRFSDEITFNADVPAYIARSATIPDYNLVVVNACETCTISNSYLAPKKFGMVPSNYPDSIHFNKAYLGFASAVYYMLQYPSNESLAKHTERLFQQFALGLPLRDALLQTQGDSKTFIPAAKRPRSRDAGTALRMVYRGDPYARVYKVYLNQAEWSSATQAERDNWFWVKP